MLSDEVMDEIMLYVSDATNKGRPAAASRIYTYTEHDEDGSIQAYSGIDLADEEDDDGDFFTTWANNLESASKDVTYKTNPEGAPMVIKAQSKRFIIDGAAPKVTMIRVISGLEKEDMEEETTMVCTHVFHLMPFIVRTTEQSSLEETTNG